MGAGWVRQRCRVSYITGASNWYWLTVGQGLVSLQHVRVEGDCFNFFCFFSFICFPLFPVPSPLLPLLLLFSLSLGGNTEWPTRVEVSAVKPQCNQSEHTGASFWSAFRWPLGWRLSSVLLHLLSQSQLLAWTTLVWLSKLKEPLCR